MSVNEVKQALGSWGLRLKKETPQVVLDTLSYFGHVAMWPGEVIAEGLTDAALPVARYVGVLRVRDLSEDYTIGGCGMAFWLGDEDGKGDVFETAVVLTAQTFAASVAALLPPSGSVTAGTINAIAGTITQTFQWQSPRDALDYVTSLFTGEWRVTGDGKLDAGTVAQLYRTVPQTLLVRRQDGREMGMRALPGQMRLASDVEDYTTRVVVLAEGEGVSISTGAANAAVVPYKDIHNNTVKLTRLVSESETDPTNATARAQLQLNRFQAARANVTLSTDAYDVKGDLVVGDYLYIWDKESGFFDVANEIPWRGEPINPIALRCIELSYPIPPGWTVAYRDVNGVWTDLSGYYEPEGGDTTVVVGDFSRNLTGIAGEPIGVRVNAPSAGADATVPAQVVFGAYSTAAYQSSAINDLKAAVQLTWTQPLNVDASTIVDGDHYEIQYRVTQAYSYPITWNQASTFHWNQLQTWGRPLSNAANTGDNWNTVMVPFDQTVALIQELSVAVEYEFRIRAVDTANPPNVGAWSSILTITTTGDVLAPSVPAAPTVAASRLGIQVVHLLGKSSGGTFNLEPDLNHLEVHVGSTFFFPDNTSLVGRIPANESNLIGKIPVVATFQLENTADVWVKVIAVDRQGNKSGASTAVQASILLIDNQHVSDLSVSKVTAGTITSDWIVAAAIKTAAMGQRVELNSLGIQAYNAAGLQTVAISADPLSSGDFVAFGDGLHTLARIDSTGVVVAKDSYVDRSFIGGVDIVADVINKRPKGIIAWGQSSVLVLNSAPNVELGYMELAFVAEANRMYRVVCFGDMDSTSAAVNERYTFRLRDGGASQPTVSSTSIGTNAFPATQSAGVNSTLTGTWLKSDFTVGLHRLLWTFFAVIGTGKLDGPSGPSFFWVEDMGPLDLFLNTGIINDGSGTPIDPVYGNTLTYNAIWAYSYNSAGQSSDSGNLGQSDGAQYAGLAGFDYNRIQSDLAGKTLLSCKLTLNYWNWYGNSGTAVLGTHDYGPFTDTWDDARVNQNRVQSPSWPEGATRSVELGTTIGNEFKSGVSKGIAVGPAPTGANVYAGIASAEFTYIKLTFSYS